jgi:hypothetical protein
MARRWSTGSIRFGITVIMYRGGRMSTGWRDGLTHLLAGIMLPFA